MAPAARSDDGSLMYLIDTNACIDFLVGRSRPLADAIGNNLGKLTVSAISEAELRVGSRSSTDRRGDLQRIDTFIGALNVAAFDSHAAARYGDLVRTTGVRRSTFDRLIGAHALALGLTLVTNNEADFADIPGLRIENWTR